MTIMLAGESCGKRLVVLVAQSRVDFHVEKFLNETFKFQLHETEK